MELDGEISHSIQAGWTNGKKMTGGGGVIGKSERILKDNCSNLSLGQP